MRGTRPCLAQAVISVRSKATGRLRPMVVARGSVPVPATGTAAVPLKLTPYGRKVSRRLSRAGRAIRVVVVARDGFDVVEQAKVRSRFVRG